MDKIAAYKEEIYKIAEEKMPKEMKTKFWKDRFVPMLKNMGGAMVGGAAGAGAGAGTAALISRLSKGKISPDDTAALMSGLSGAGTGIGGLGGHIGTQVYRTNKLHKKEFGENAPGGVHGRALASRLLVPYVGSFLGTPEAAVKKEMRTKWQKQKEIKELAKQMRDSK